MPLIKDGHRVDDDPWRMLADDEPVPAFEPVVVSLDRWREERETLAGRNAPVGIRLASDEPAHEIADDVDAFALIALEFPNFKDGRAYTTARLLRERYGFAGELRAVGEVLRDQLLFMQRCGFDAFELRKEADADAFADALGAFSHVYQPAGDRRAPVLALRHRKSAAE